MEKAQQLEILKKLISIQSVNGNEVAVADYIESLFAPYQNQGVAIQRITYAPRRDNLVITIGSGDQVLAFGGHEDVVAVEDASRWTTDPFTAKVEDGKLYGRGATDMKSGLAAMVIAMLELLESGEIPGRIRLFCTVGEETGEYGAAQLTKLGYADNLAGLIVSEPTNNMTELGYTSKGVIDYAVTAIGKQAHSSQPENGINAIDHLIDFATQVKQVMTQFDQVNPVLGRLTHVQSVFNGGLQINSVPAKAVIKGNIRTIPEYPNQVIFDVLDQLVARLNRKPGYQLSIRYSYPEEAMPGDKNAPLIKLMERVYNNVFDHPVKLVGQTGASDGSEFLHGQGDFPIALIGPGNKTQHQTDEYVEVETFYQAINFYQQVAKEFFVK